jgi:hypothetical protein
MSSSAKKSLSKWKAFLFVISVDLLKELGFGYYVDNNQDERINYQRRFISTWGIINNFIVGRYRTERPKQN